MRGIAQATTVPPPPAAQGLQGLHGLQGFAAAQGLQGLAAQGLQGFAAAQGLHGLQGFFTAQGLHGLQALAAAQGLQGFFTAQGLQGLHAAWAMGTPICPETTMPPAATPAKTTMGTMAVDINKRFLDFIGSLPDRCFWSLIVPMAQRPLSAAQYPQANALSLGLAGSSVESRRLTIS
ncbi:hypothetical protein [Pelagibius sp.]|uniref:hypothetical protein n=1 Tax=Pelagibius sp. TaxID=1931238 RepID=UPI0026289EFA|nr:hypothetical protein [Pelagibius sp.]